MNPFKWITGSRKKGAPILLSITPPRTGQRTMLGVENLLQSIAVPEPFSLELVGDRDGVRLLVRCLDSQVVRRQIALHYPQARVELITTGDDPLSVPEDQEAWTMTLRSSGPDQVPLRQFRDTDLVDEGSDPMLALVGAMSALRGGERIVSRLLLRSLGPQWSAAYQQEEIRRSTYRSAATEEARVNHGEIARLMLLAGGAFVGLRTWQFWQEGDVLRAIAVAGGAALAVVVLGVLWARFGNRTPRFYDPQLVKEKVSRTAFGAVLQVTAIVPHDEGRRHAKELLDDVAAAYRHYDNPAGAQFVVGKIRPAPEAIELQAPGPGLFGKRSVLGVREVASLWHPPNPGDETPPVERTGSRVLLPSPQDVSRGAHVGNSTGGSAGEIRFADDLLRRHHLYVARTRMGKSTLMQHIVAHKMREKAEGRDGDAIVVIDPHADLVASLLEHVPESLADQVRVIDLADPNGAPGINLLDTRIFTDRDRTADSVVRIAKGLWDQWGPRMQSILEQIVKTLHEANESMEVDNQYTILDGLPLLASENGKFRSRVLKKVEDIHLLEWWARDFNSWHKQYRSEALAPVQTRLSYYATSKRARAILGQRRSTIDIRQTIREGGILFVSTAQGVAGRDVSALVGSSLLNLVDAVIREQGERPLRERRGVLVVVDEMQSMPGVDYDSMLSELGKFGASFVLATQSLAKLDDLSDTMRHSLLANVGCLAVFQVAASDAKQLVGELGTDRVSQDDITSLPVHHCYVRATVGTERMPAFSMMVRKPEPGNMALAQQIRDATVDYTTSHKTLTTRDASLDRLVEQYRSGIDDMDMEVQQPPPQPPKQETQQNNGKKQHRRKKNKNDQQKGRRKGNAQSPKGRED